MTVSSTTVKNSYSGNGSNDTFVYGFKIFADTDLEVIIRSATGTETIKTLTTHYTVTNAGSASGGNVVFTSGNIPTATETVVVRREVPQTQAIDYIANDPFPAESHEEGLDRATMTIQQMQEELDRSFKVSSTNSITTPEFTDNAATRASKTLGFDSTGQVLTTVADFLPAGGDSALFQYSTTTTDADPGAGFFRLDNATIASAAEMYIDDLEYNGTNVEAWVQSWDDVSGNDTNRGRIRITKAQSLDTWMVFKVTGAITNASGYTKVTLVYIDSAGTFLNNDKCWVAFTASGEDGAIPGYFYKFDTNTADSDPGAGELKFNNGTYASATAIYIDDADANGVTTQADTATWGASDSVIKGFIHIVDINDSSTYARFKVGAAVTDASGYNKITVAHLTSNNTFSAADELSVTFVRNGDFGDAATIEVGTVGVSTVSVGGSATATVANAGSDSEATFNFAFGIPTGATGADGDVTAAGVATLTNKTLTAPKINEDVAVTSTATELNLLDGKAATNLALVGKQEGTNFTSSLLIGHATTGTLSSAGENTGVGIAALDALTNGDDNTALGSNAGSKINSGSANTALGRYAGNNITTGDFNSYVGSLSGQLTTGNRNSAIGYLAAKSLNSGADNIAIGEQALVGTGAVADKNIAIGKGANKIVTTGASNITIGYQSGDNITSGDGNVIIGSINADSATADKQLIVADGVDGSIAWIKGDSSGNLSVPANLNLSGSNKELRFYEGANYVGFEAPALSADKIWVLPAADGSADQVLKTDGSGNLGFATAASGQFRTLISTSTITSSTSTLTITGMDSTYSRYFVTMSDIHSTHDNVTLYVQLVIGGAVKTGTNYEYANYGRNSNDGATGVNVTGGNYWKVSTQTQGFATGEALMGEIILYNPSGTTTFKSGAWNTILHDEEGDTLVNSGGGGYKDGVAAATGVHFYYSVGNIASGVWKLWGSNE